ncbi:MAG: hypothetical protein ACKVT1_07255 [Dehalococcoidia bacterium]
MHSLRWLLIASILALPLLGACDDGTETAPVAAPPSAAGTPPATATTSQPAATPPAPAGTPTAVKPANEGPRVLWMVRDRAGPGVIVVRFATDVETTAVLSMAVKAGDTPAVEPQEDRTFAKSHTISIPLGEKPAFASVEVTDRQGRTGTGALEHGALVANDYWSGGSSAPNLKINQGTVLAIWTNRRGELAGKGTVQLFAKKPGCTTAEVCLGEPAGVFAADAPQGGASFETHTIPFRLDSGSDWQVILTAPVFVGAGGKPAARFYQVDVRASELK